MIKWSCHASSKSRNLKNRKCSETRREDTYTWYQPSVYTETPVSTSDNEVKPTGSQRVLYRRKITRTLVGKGFPNRNRCTQVHRKRHHKTFPSIIDYSRVTVYKSLKHWVKNLVSNFSQYHPHTCGTFNCL